MTSNQCRGLLDRYVRWAGKLFYCTIPEHSWPDLLHALEQAGADWLAFPVRDQGHVEACTADGTQLRLLALGVHVVSTEPLGGTRDPIPVSGITAVNVMSAFLSKRLGPVSVSPGWAAA